MLVPVLRAAPCLSFDQLKSSFISLSYSCKVLVGLPPSPRLTRPGIERWQLFLRVLLILGSKGR